MQYFFLERLPALFWFCVAYPQFEISSLEHLRSVDNSTGEKSYGNYFVIVLLSATKEFLKLHLWNLNSLKME